jgi:hypothetical protein
MYEETKHAAVIDPSGEVKRIIAQADAMRCDGEDCH